MKAVFSGFSPRAASRARVRAASCVPHRRSPLRARARRSTTSLFSPVHLHCEGERQGSPSNRDGQVDRMLLPMMSTAREALSSTLLGRLLGPSSSSNERRDGDESPEPLPPLKFKIGQEPNTPRAGSPGFQDGHWVCFGCGGFMKFLVPGCCVEKGVA